MYVMHIDYYVSTYMHTYIHTYIHIVSQCVECMNTPELNEVCWVTNIAVNQSMFPDQLLERMELYGVSI